ncbi:MAG TPA: hypothetical protein VNG69_06860, partial [Casimicrobiaceae bacterium]|nr:hypothetical protein [Casimicrobiaceae bacterium]
KHATLSVAQAHKAAAAALALIAAGKHPATEKRISQAAKAADRRTTFKVIANAWVVTGARRKQWSDDYIEEVTDRFATICATWTRCQFPALSRASFVWPSPITRHGSLKSIANAHDISHTTLMIGSTSTDVRAYRGD